MLIGEVARRTGVSVRMLRHYDSLGLVTPSGHTSGGHRQYSSSDLRRLFHVTSLRSLGLTLRQVGEILDEPGFDPQGLIASLVAQTEARIEKERELLTTLRHVADAEPRAWDEVLRAIALLRDLDSSDPAVRQRVALTGPGSGAVVPRALTEAALREPVPDVAGALRWALRRGGGADLEEIAAIIASGSDGPMRRRAVELVRDAPSSSRRTALLTALLEDADPEIRAAAALELGGEGIAAAVPPLLAMVVDGVKDVEAADALTLLSWDEEHADTIIEGFTHELAVTTLSTAARLRLLQALVELPHVAASELLADAAQRDDPGVARVAEALLAVRSR